MTYLASDLCEKFAHIITTSRNLDAEFSRIDSTDDYQSESLIFVSESSSLALQEHGMPAVLVTCEEIAVQINEESLCVIVVQDVRVAQAVIKQHYFDYDATDSEWEPIHPSAVIHASATLGERVRVGANSVIGADVVIGNDTIIRANCVIEHDVEIGQSCTINNMVNIGYGCRLGNRVILQPAVIIGSEGFGFAQDSERRYHRVPHTGIVEIKDDVQIGSHGNIDRATYGKTIINRGVKIDALCHIAHNVVIGEDVLLIAQSGVAGSSNIGDRVIASGHTAITDHTTIADDAVLVHRCGVTEDITMAGMWAGTPARPFKEYVKSINTAKRLEKLSAKVAKLEKS